MKTFAIILLGVAVVSAIPLDESLYEEEPSEDGWFVPQIDGSFEWVSQEEASLQLEQLSTQQSRSAVTVDFYLYTRLNPTTPYQIYTGDTESLANSTFNNNYPTRFIIHGWHSSYLADLNIEIRSALLAVGDFNVISVDWSEEAKNPNYTISRSYVPTVGQEVAAFIDFLHQQGEISFENLTIIGHSLGAQVSGFTGKYVTQGKIHVIIGLDPAFPLFNYSDCSQRLCVTDAIYVESVQTDGGKLGFVKPIGKAAFYPNGGSSQPGCSDDENGECSHLRAYMYYAEAVKYNDFLSIKCPDYEEAIVDECGSTYSPNVRFGAPTNYLFADGVYYTPVNAEFPFGKGYNDTENAA